MPWIPRGLRDGIVTTRYPRRTDGYDDGFRGAVAVVPAPPAAPTSLVPDPAPDVLAAAAACPTGAITTGPEGVRLDRGRCILCGRCVERAPDRFRFEPGVEVSSTRPAHLVVPPTDWEQQEEGDDQAVERARQQLAARVRALRRSVHVRHLDAGSDGADEWEVAALTNPIYDVQRLGIFFTASPRHADLLLVTGVGAAGMLEPLRRTYDTMPGPKVVVAAGVDALSGGLVGQGYASRGGVTGLVGCDVLVPGSPATPFGLLHGILVAVGLLAEPRPGAPSGGART